MTRFIACLLLLVALSPLPAAAQHQPTWTTRITPFRIADNLYYVGSQDLASYLVVTRDGAILINANLATSPPQIRASVEQLGFRWTDIKILLNSQAHYDHMAGAAEVIRETHAKNQVMDGDVHLVETGGRVDFARTIDRYTPVHVDRELHDGMRSPSGVSR
jgi:metallo-beta-lactamase class B